MSEGPTPGPEAGRRGDGRRPPRVLWANRYCLLDTSSGASISAREMLRQLAARGVEVHVLGATVFDAEAGRGAVQAQLDSVAESAAPVVAVPDGALRHRLVRTGHWRSGAMTLDEISTWMTLYQQELDEARPDLVMYYGGRPPDWLIAAEAKARGIPTAAYLVNGSYKRTRWCRDVDVILTDTQATADLYAERLGLTLHPVGRFIDADRVVAAEHARTHVTFVGAVLAKGAALVAQLALALEERRPDIRFEVVEGRGSWTDILREVSAATGRARTELSNVDLTPSAKDMRPVYGRSRVLLAPSLWWESGARVIAEAQLNGVPVVTTARGGAPEMVGAGGYVIELPEVYHEPPYARLLTAGGLERLTGVLEQLHDDADTYREMSARAAAHALRHHRMDASTRRLLGVLRPYLGPVGPED